MQKIYRQPSRKTSLPVFTCTKQGENHFHGFSLLAIGLTLLVGLDTLCWEL